MNKFERQEGMQTPAQLTAYDKTLGILVHRVDELRAKVAAKTEPSEDDILWGISGEEPHYGFLDLEGVRTPLSLESMGNVEVDVKYIIERKDPEAPQPDDDMPKVISVLFVLHKDGVPFNHPSDMTDAEIKERLDDSHEEAYRVKTEIQANEYELLVSSELPPMLVQSCQLYEDPWIDAEVMQSANKHYLSDHDFSQLLDVIGAAEAWY